MTGGIVVDVLMLLVAAAIVFGVIAWFSHYHDAETIDEEERTVVERETPEERAQARLRDAERLAAHEAEEERGGEGYGE